MRFSLGGGQLCKRNSVFGGKQNFILECRNKFKSNEGGKSKMLPRQCIKGKKMLEGSQVLIKELGQDDGWKVTEQNSGSPSTTPLPE